MSAYTPAGIVNQAFTMNDTMFTYALSGVIDPVNDVGKAVSQDTTTPGTVKKCGPGDAIFGRIETIEVRTVIGVTVATVARSFKCAFPAPLGHGIVLGDCVMGHATVAGNVTTASGSRNAEPKANRVIEVQPTFVVVESF